MGADSFFVTLLTFIIFQLLPLPPFSGQVSRPQDSKFRAVETYTFRVAGLAQHPVVEPGEFAVFLSALLTNSRI